jgi:hypothetical protein
MNIWRSTQSLDNMNEKEIREAIASAYRSIGIIKTRLSVGIYKDAEEKKLLEKINKELLNSISQLEKLDELQDTLAKAKSDLRKEITNLSFQWSASTSQFVVQITDWLIENYSHYFEQVAGHPSISSWEDSKRKAVGSTSSAVFIQSISITDDKVYKSVIKAGFVTYSTEIGVATGGFLGGAAGFVVGIIADIVVNKFVDGILPDTAPGLAKERKKLIEKQLSPIKQSLRAIRDTNMKTFAEMHSKDKKTLEKIQDLDMLRGLKNCYEDALQNIEEKLNQVNIDDRSLSNGLLKQWVLDYAGDDAESPSKHLPQGLEEVWTESIQNLKDSKDDDGEPYLPQGKGLSNIPTVFINQYKVNIQLMGLSLKSKGLSPFLDLYESSINEVMREVGEAIENQDYNSPPPRVVDRLYSKLNKNHKIKFDLQSDVSNLSILMTFLSRTLTKTTGKEKIVFAGGMERYELIVDLHLEKDEASIFVISLEWIIEPKSKNTGYYAPEENSQSGYENL